MLSVSPVSVTHIIPTVGFSCFLFCFISETEGECPSHLIVLCRGRVFAFDAIHEGNMVTPPEIFRSSNYLVSNKLSYLSYIPKRVLLFLSPSPQRIRRASGYSFSSSWRFQIWVNPCLVGGNFLPWSMMIMYCCNTPIEHHTEVLNEDVSVGNIIYVWSFLTWNY